MRANKYEKINELMPDIKMSSANAFVSHAINSAFIPWLVPLCYIVDYKEKYIHTIYSPSSGILQVQRHLRDTRTDPDTPAQLGLPGTPGQHPSISKKHSQLRPLASPHAAED